MWHSPQRNLVVIALFLWAVQIALTTAFPLRMKKNPIACMALKNSANNGEQEFLFSRREAWQTAKEAAALAASLSASSLIQPRIANAEEELPLSSGVPTVRLGKSNLEVSRTIQGYWQLAGGHGRYSESDAIANMKAHFEAGITTLDTADIYGPSELIVGKFVKTEPKAVPCTKFCCFRYLEVR